jgi:hypothetical protein
MRASNARRTLGGKNIPTRKPHYISEVDWEDLLLHLAGWRIDLLAIRRGKTPRQTARTLERAAVSLVTPPPNRMVTPNVLELVEELGEEKG